MKFQLIFSNEISNNIFINRTPLHMAIANGYPEVVKLLLGVSQIDPNGRSIPNQKFFNVISN